MTTPAMPTPPPAPDPPPMLPMTAPLPPSGVGYVVNRSQIDMQIGQLAREIEQWAPRAVALRDWLKDYEDDDLAEPPFQYNADDAKALRAAAADLAKVAEVYLGKSTQAHAADLGRHSRKMAGMFWR